MLVYPCVVRYPDVRGHGCSRDAGGRIERISDDETKNVERKFGRVVLWTLVCGYAMCARDRRGETPSGCSTCGMWVDRFALGCRAAGARGARAPSLQELEENTP